MAEIRDAGGGAVGLLTMGSFKKTHECVPAEDLLHIGSMEAGQLPGEIARHLSACDFCTAEAGFYRNYPPVNETFVAAGVIPQPLRELAEALLHRKRDLSPLDRLVSAAD